MFIWRHWFTLTPQRKKWERIESINHSELYWNAHPLLFPISNSIWFFNCGDHAALPHTQKKMNRKKVLCHAIEEMNWWINKFLRFFFFVEFLVEGAHCYAVCNWFSLTLTQMLSINECNTTHRRTDLFLVPEFDRLWDSYFSEHLTPVEFQPSFDRSDLVRSFKKKGKLKQLVSRFQHSIHHSSLTWAHVNCSRPVNKVKKDCYEKKKVSKKSIGISLQHTMIDKSDLTASQFINIIITHYFNGIEQRWEIWGDLGSFKTFFTLLPIHQPKK